MSDDTEQNRYLYIVRQRFGEAPVVDAFYKLRVPAGLTGDQAQVMTKLHKGWCKDEIAEDTRALEGMKLRIRFNSDMYQKVCLVRTDIELTAEDLEHVIQSKYERGEMQDFLDKSAV